MFYNLIRSTGQMVCPAEAPHGKEIDRISFIPRRNFPLGSSWLFLALSSICASDRPTNQPTSPNGIPPRTMLAERENHMVRMEWMAVVVPYENMTSSTIRGLQVVVKRHSLTQ